MTRCWFESTQPATRERVGVVREQLRLWVRPLNLGQEFVEDCLLALGEAATNAVVHGSPHGERDPFQVRCEAGRQTITIEVTDAGPGFAFRSAVLPDPLSDAEHGRGLWLMQSVTDLLVVHHRACGTRVCMHKHLPGYWTPRGAVMQVPGWSGRSVQPAGQM